MNRPKATDELAVLSWNTNWRLDLRGCRENLLGRWALRGFVDVALIQEHFKDDNSPLFNLFGSGWSGITVVVRVEGALFLYSPAFVLMKASSIQVAKFEVSLSPGAS